MIQNLKPGVHVTLRDSFAQDLNVETSGKSCTAHHAGYAFINSLQYVKPLSSPDKSTYLQVT